MLNEKCGRSIESLPSCTNWEEYSDTENKIPIILIIRQFLYEHIWHTRANQIKIHTHSHWYLRCDICFASKWFSFISEYQFSERFPTTKKNEGNGHIFCSHQFSFFYISTLSWYVRIVQCYTQLCRYLPIEEKKTTHTQL